jgi:arylsulfatase A-like enzyme
VNRREAIKAGLGLATGIAGTATSSPADSDQRHSQRPNVLIIMCDQLNASALSCYGGWIPAPNLERLAHRGVAFTNATCTTPWCSPSRASLITGRYPHSHGIVFNVNKIDYPTSFKAPDPNVVQGITINDTTTEKLLNAAGYSTHQYGKWHLAETGGLPYYPDQYGENIEYAREMAATFERVRRLPRDQWMEWYSWALPVTTSPAYQRIMGSLRDKSGQPPAPHFMPESIAKAGRLNFQADQTFDYRVAQRTIETLLQPRANPFMITCSLNWPHDPNVVISPYYERFDPDRIRLPASFGKLEPRFETDFSREIVTVMGAQQEAGLRELLRIYAGGVGFVDDQVGRVLDALHKTGQSDNTIVVFTADHGEMAGAHGMFWKSTTSFYDEVARVPLIISYPRRIKPGKNPMAASLVSIMPTLLDLVGHPLPPGVQGDSLAPYLLGQRDPDSAPPFSFGERVQGNRDHTRNVAPGTPASFMVRGKGWKYFNFPDGGEFLYHLSEDPGEMENLATQPGYNGQKEALKQELQAWLERTGYPGA